MTSNTLLRACLAALLCTLSLAVQAGDWSHRQKIVFDTSATGADLGQEVGQLPLGLRLHSGNFPFAEAKADGSDLRFLAADGKTPLKFHLEKFDVANELAVAWVTQPKLAAKAESDAVYLEWGNPKATSSADAKGTFDAAQLFVLHFSDQGGVRDATGNAHHAREATAKPLVDGPLGGAMAFAGAERIVLPAAPSLRLGSGGFTFSAWLKPADAASGRLLSVGDNRALSIELVAGRPVVTMGTSQAKAAAVLTPGVWQHVAVSAGDGKLNFYVDGREAGGGAFVLGEAAGDVVIGQGYRGELDEATLAGVARPADYLKALAVSQAAESPMIVFEEEGGDGESVSYMRILLGAVTVDGWVVIAILGVMAVISFVVMIGKARFLAVTKRGNESFLQRFRGASTEMLEPASHAAAAAARERALAGSSLYRIYAIGIEEIRHRFAAQARNSQDQGLSAAALDAIRASLDAGLVRENHRLNSQIVLLTIAISGGPFLGLLGTVVGVMITFAAIAAAGDVNVNSIAPGIAAALVATVAGLGVAIPALFGYNWLASQIRNISADMQVFADEFLTKAAEQYAR